MRRPNDTWIASGVRTPFSKVDGALQALDALELSVPVARHMVGLLKGGRPDFAVWGAVVPSLMWSNIARERPARDRQHLRRWRAGQRPAAGSSLMPGLHRTHGPTIR